MRKIRPAFLLLGCSLGFAFAGTIFNHQLTKAEEASFTSLEQYSFWTMKYYKKPEPKKVPESFLFISNSIERKPNAKAPTVVFYSYIFKKNSKALAQTFALVDKQGSEGAKLMMANVLAATGTRASRNLLIKAQKNWTSPRLQRVISGKLAEPTPDVYSLQGHSTVKLDMLWAIFFATGDSKSIKEIISVLHLKETGSGSEIMVGGAANWSLASNIKEHDRVREIAESEVKKSKGVTKKLLKEALIKKK